MPSVMRSVYSSNVNRIGHDPSTNTLLVEWDNGKTSAYDGVSAALANQVSNAHSIGKALHAQVKGKFPHRYIGS